MKAKSNRPARRITRWNPKVILVPTDFSYPAEQALKHALALARETGARLSLIHVINHAIVPDMVFASANMDVPLLKKLASDRLARLRERFKLKPAHGVVREGHAAEEVLNFAREIKAGLIVIASRGHSALERVLIGSTAERIVRLADCPVLIIPLASHPVPVQTTGTRKRK